MAQNLSSVLDEIRAVLPEGGDWCTMDKASTLAAMVFALRPMTVVEIGVWMGGSAIPIAISLKALGSHVVSYGGVIMGSARKLVAIDPWASQASTAGQDGDNAAWWSAVDHDRAYDAFRERVEKHKLKSIVQIVRSTSDAAAIVPQTDLLHIDGNHGEQALRDVRKFCPHVTMGGLVILDDLNWRGGHVMRARDFAESIGFTTLYEIDTGVVMQRTSVRQADVGPVNDARRDS